MFQTMDKIKVVESCPVVNCLNSESNTVSEFYCCIIHTVFDGILLYFTNFESVGILILEELFIDRTVYMQGSSNTQMHDEKKIKEGNFKDISLLFDAFLITLLTVQKCHRIRD